MWRVPINFVTLHYAYIIFMSLLAIVVLYPRGNMSAIDAYFFGASASTESGLNTIDIKSFDLYQQLYIYFIPILTNLAFVNLIVVVVRLFWFKKHLSNVAPQLLGRDEDTTRDIEGGKSYAVSTSANTVVDARAPEEPNVRTNAIAGEAISRSETRSSEARGEAAEPQRAITFDATAEKDNHPKMDAALYIPGPRERDNGHPLVELDKEYAESQDDLSIREAPAPGPSSKSGLRRRVDAPSLSEARSLERVANVATSMFVIGSEPSRLQRRPSAQSQQPELNDRPFLSSQATLGRNSQFHNLTSADRAALGGIEYRALKLLLKIASGYFVGLHIFGAISLVGWIQYANPKYREYLAECGQDKNWWAFYSSQTMISNLGFTLTPDSMISFRDAEWPMFVMSFLAFAGNTLYPVFLRLVIWIMYKLYPKSASTRESLAFLLDHPRRCYTLLFPSGTTWALFGIIFALNFIDTLLIIVLDLDNPEVNALPIGPRILAAIFQAASSRHTGTATFNLANVNPAVQFSLLVMMYIAVFPVAVALRASNTYEEKSLGVYEREGDPNENNGSSYLLTHMQNQLSFDLWYIFLGIFCILVSESKRVMDPEEPVSCHQRCSIGAH
ncbi:hypothetical protein VHEMI09968 [[Torrubiella] hemipterigena]|uniref:Potassium transport protein n=1 Tax=[Torrubiella] hemipterigena TaxID=1531966 RepID=A0A0A1TR05_9HYPO|nr:hypothetical protein VHEMI09968 [[Torrubiella] hemipterigena]